MLRRFRAADAAALSAYRSDPDTARYQSWDAPFPLDGADAFVAAMAVADPDGPGWFQYAVERTADHVLVGDVGVDRYPGGRQAELGFTLAPQYRGHGYATEAVTAVLDHLFRVRGMHRVSAECDGRNLASARLLERVGFTREGLRRQHTWAKGEWTDDLLYGLLATDWLARR
ncbi:GNAT family N-acetyltransferase [Krasilnikovia sp. MM14-A1004]|uniref:GNAT family N-acetyltransferase n=1 Tax=Krasilnikovia sp. MM14-A1004 TaxID=3373541 RepID=UPI00399D4625